MSGREFYSVETDDDGCKWVKYQGYTWHRQCDEDLPYACTTICKCYICVSGSSSMSNYRRMVALAERRQQYQEDLTEAGFEEANATFFNGSPGEELHVDEVTPETPDGDYFFTVADL